MNFLPEEFEEILNIFRDESSEIIQKFNNSLLRLEQTPDDEKNILSLFQEAHSLKGAARMIGFNSIQNLAHKIEDVLTLIKTKKVATSKEIISRLYKVSDFLQFLIEKSVQEKEDYKSSSYGDHWKALDEISDMKGTTTSTNPINFDKNKTDPNYFINEVQNINALILESFFVLERFDESEKETHLSILTDNFNSLYEIFAKCNLKQLEELFHNLKNLCSNFSKHLDLLNEGKTEEIRQTLIKATNILNKKYEENSIEKITEIEEVNNISEDSIKNEPLSESIKQPQNSPVKEKIEYLLSIISQIKIDVSYIENSQKNILEILGFGIDDEISKIYKKMFDILELIKKQDIKPNNDVIKIFTQSILLTKNSILDEKRKDNEDIGLLYQRLSILEQMIDITEDKQQPLINSTKNDVAPEPEFQKVQDFIKSFEIGSIKTLRVDTKKLDTLIAQMGELIINGIKTKKHLSQLDKFNQKLVDWNNNYKKAVNYIKYCDKKNINKIDAIENLNLYNKQLLSMFENNQVEINNLIKDVNHLYKQINEDDIKLNHIIYEIEDIVKNIRVLPLATIFHMFPRMVRDIAANSNKEVELLISGSETTVDKKILEEIKMPLIHILRNSIDHGIETPEERIAKGKPSVGKIQLSAKIEENKIIIIVEDDGFGINIRKIKETALNKGLLTPEEIKTMSDDQLMNLIFWPGFSTGDKITEISGRGIGLDIVQTKIAQLNGKIKICSIINKGAKVIIELPVSMSTIKSFIVDISNQKFAIPISSIKLVQWIDRDKIFQKDGYNAVLINNESIPIVDLGHILGLGSSKSKLNKHITVIIMESANTQIAYIVDKLLGDQEILHKKLAPPIFRLKYISGITTLAEGDLCLILNTSELLNNISNNIEKLINHSKKLDLIPKNTTNKKEYKIAIVDDSKTTLALLEKIIKSEGYSQTSFTNPLIALESIKKEKYDLIITDIEMPEFNGKQFIKELKSDENLATIPIIVISTLPVKKLKIELKEYNIKNYISKQDFNKDNLLNIIKNIK